MEENSASGLPSEKKSPDLLDYVEVVAKDKKRILGVTGTVFVVLLTVSIFSSDIYESTVRILPPQQDQGLMALMLGGGGLPSLAGNFLNTATPADQYASILQSERIMDSIIDRFNLMEEYKKKHRIRMYKKMPKIVKVKASRKDGIITITAADKDPRKAADIANAYIDELGTLVAEMGTTDASRNRKFLEARLAGVKADLAQAEDALKTFQLKNKAIDVPGQAKASIESVAFLRAQLASQEAQLSALRSQFTDSSREVQTTSASVKDLRSQIARLEGTGGGAIPSVGSVPALGQEQVRLLREFKTQEMLAELLTKQYELARLNEANTTNMVQVIQRARPSDYLAKKKFRKRYVLMLSFVAFICASSWAVLKDYTEKMPAESKERWERISSLIRGRSI